MSETPAPYNSPDPPPETERIARFLDGYLGQEILLDHTYPTHLQGDYEDFDDEKKKEWFEFTFHTLFRDTTQALVDFLHRDFTLAELGLVKRRVVNFLKQSGFEYDKG
jgi:hypothetical protein